MLQKSDARLATVVVGWSVTLVLILVHASTGGTEEWVLLATGLLGWLVTLALALVLHSTSSACQY